MGAPLHSRAAGLARAAIEDIQATVGVLALLHAGDRIETADMQSAVRSIEAKLQVLAAAIDIAADDEACLGLGDQVRLPIMTLAEVAARARYRAQPTLRLAGGTEA